MTLLVYLASNHSNPDSQSNCIIFFLAIGGDNNHPAPLDCMRRMRLLLLGKDLKIIVNKPSVEIENDADEELLKWEHSLERLPGEEEIHVATQLITNDVAVNEFELDDEHELFDDQISLTDQPSLTLKEEYERKISCSYQVLLILDILLYV